jgi:hypothetical protein
MTITVFFSKVNDKTIVMEFEPSTTIKTLKDDFFKLCYKMYVQDYSDYYKLIYAGRFLYDNNKTLDELGIQNENTIYITGGLKSCSKCIKC